MYYIDDRSLDRHLAVKAERVTNESVRLGFFHQTNPAFFVRILWYSNMVGSFGTFFFLGNLIDISGVSFIVPKIFFDFIFSMIASSRQLPDVS